MIDKIINFKSEDKNEILKFQEEITKMKNARYLYLFSYYIKNYDKEKLVKDMLILDNKRYITFLARTIDIEDYTNLIDKIISYKDAKALYYAVYDKPNIEDKYIEKIFKELIKLNDKRYIYLFMNYYFCIKEGKSEIVYKDTIDTLKVLNIDVSCIDGINEKLFILLEKCMDKYNERYDILNIPDRYTENVYKDRNGYTPDMIVCHITNSYNKGILNFYDESLEVSAHYIISKNGDIRKVADLKDGAWANGTSIKDTSDLYYKFATNKYVKERKINANYYTFSIEHESLDGNLTDAQYASSLKCMKEIIKFVKEKYDMDFVIDRKHIIGHKEINPIVRRVCPGSKFPFDRFIKDLKEGK